MRINVSNVTNYFQTTKIIASIQKFEGHIETVSADNQVNSLVRPPARRSSL